jgi:hypothetical protein
VPTAAPKKGFDDFSQQLQRRERPNQMPGPKYLVSLNGSQYFSSEKIHCPSCLTRKGARGRLRYSHQNLELCDTPYQRCCAMFISRKDCWNHLRVAICLLQGTSCISRALSPIPRK